MIRTAFVFLVVLLSSVAWSVADSFDRSPDGSDFMFEGDKEAALDWAESRGCTWSICNWVSELLTGGNSGLGYVDEGFLITGLRGYELELNRVEPSVNSQRYQFLSFGIWAENTYWGFWQKAPEPASSQYATHDEYEDYIESLFGSHLFFAGGINPSMPTTGVWRGLASGAHETLAGDTRVGHSEIVVNLNASELDVKITGLGFDSIIQFPTDDAQQEFAAAGGLVWKGLPLHGDGSFDEPRILGRIDNLDDAFAAELPIGGEYYSQTADTIQGQFYGPNGGEVVGVFHKLGIQGSFGAYREE